MCNFWSPTLRRSHHPMVIPCPTCAQRSCKADCACAKPDQRAQRAPSTAEDNLWQEIHHGEPVSSMFWNRNLMEFGIGSPGSPSNKCGMMMNDVENLSLWHMFEDFSFGWDCLAKISWQTRGMMTP